MECKHISKINSNIKPSSKGCEECLKVGDSWVHLRKCMICGKVGCCDSSKNTHARKHFEETGHEIIENFESSDKWKWCYVDDDYV